MHKLLCFALLALGLLAGAAPAHAQSADVIRVLASEARPDFPNEIVFTLTAEAADAPISEVQLLYGSARDESLTIVSLSITPAQRVEVRHILDTQVYYSPPGTEMAYRWLIRDAAGNELVSPPQELVYHDDRFPWRERSARNVIVYWYDGDEAFGDELIAAATESLDRLERDIGATLSLPVRIYIYASTRDMRSALEANEVEWIGGAAWSNLGVIVGAIAPGNSAEVDRLIPHELSHQVLHQATDNPYGGMPFWFNEGLAVHNQGVRDGGFDQLVSDAARQGRLIPLEALASSFPADPDQALLSYAQSRDMVEYIIATYGEEKLQSLVRAFAEATPVDQALQDVLGRTVDELDAEWRATLPEVGAAPTPEAVEQFAPADRFSEPPVLPDGAAAAPAPTPALPGPSSWEEQITRLPAWASLGGLALCCLTGVLLAGALLLMGLRMLGVDKRTG